MTENNEKLMELRDKFAGQALEGTLAHSTRYKPREGAGIDWHISIAKEAYELADCMLMVRDMGIATTVLEASR